MKLLENPIFITERRRIHRAGVVAAVAASVLVGFTVLTALGYRLVAKDLPQQTSLADFGKGCYAWCLVAQALMLIIGGFSRISKTMVDERKEGLLDLNRLTPLKGGDMVRGYWFGSPLREFYMAVVLVPVGLAVVIMAGLPLSLWLGTQVLLFSTALFFGLLAVLAGMAMSRAQGGMGIVAVLLITMPITLAGQQFSITNFVLPVYGALNLFQLGGTTGTPAWHSPAHFFGVAIPPLVFTLALQLILGVYLWRGAVRKCTHPFRPAFSRWEVVIVFGLLVLFQYGLIWKWLDADFWQYRYDNPIEEISPRLCLIFMAVLLVGLSILVSQSVNAETARILAIRSGTTAKRQLVRRSGPVTAVVLAAIAIAGLLTQFNAEIPQEGMRYAIVVLNVVVVFTSFAFGLEICRFRFGRRWMGAFLLLLFVLYVLPVLLGATFWSLTPVQFSMATPGGWALSSGSEADDLTMLLRATMLQGAVILLLAWIWWTRLRQWVARVVA